MRPFIPQISLGAPVGFQFVAAVARIHLDGALPSKTLDAMRAESPDIMELSVLKL